MRYLFHRLHQAEPKTIRGIAWIVPLFVTTLACGLNLFCVVGLILWATGKLPQGHVDDRDVKACLLLIVVTINLVLYRRWIASARYAQFAKEFRSESSAQRRIRTVLLYAYGLATVVAPIMIGYFAGKHR